MKVTIDLPDRVWGRLASIADYEGRKVGDVIGALIAARVGAEAFGPAPRPAWRGVKKVRFTATQNAEIRRLGEAGVRPFTIARLFDCDPATISAKLRRWAAEDAA